MDFVKKHWTWIAGLLGAVITYVKPAASAGLANFVFEHGWAASALGGVAAFILHALPSPFSKSNS